MMDKRILYQNPAKSRGKFVPAHLTDIDALRMGCYGSGTRMRTMSGRGEGYPLGGIYPLGC